MNEEELKEKFTPSVYYIPHFPKLEVYTPEQVLEIINSLK